MTVIINREDADKLLAVSNLDIDKGVLKVSTGNMLEGRLYKLQDGDIFSVSETLIEHYENKLYEVRLTYNFDEHIGVIMPEYERTGKVFTIKEVEDLAV